MPFRIEHPHGHERVMDLAALDRCIALPRRAGLITRHSLFQRASQRTCTARIGALAAVLRRHIELVGKEARKIGCREGLQLAVIIRLDGVHVLIRHLFRSVHRDLFKGQTSGAVGIVVIRLRDPVVAAFVCARAGGVEVRVALRLAAEHPKRNIDAADLLQMIFAGKALRQEYLTLIMLLEPLDRVLAAELEGDHEVRLQRSRKLPRHDRGVAAVGAGGRGGGRVTDELRAAARAVIGLHALALRTPVGAEV